MSSTPTIIISKGQLFLWDFSVIDDHNVMILLMEADTWVANSTSNHWDNRKDNI